MTQAFIIEKSLEARVSARLPGGLIHAPLYIEAADLLDEGGALLVTRASLVVVGCPRRDDPRSRFLIRTLRQKNVHASILVIGWMREGAPRRFGELARYGADDVFLFDLAAEGDRFSQQVSRRLSVPALESALDIVAEDVHDQPVRAIASWCVRNAYLRVSTGRASAYFDRDCGTLQRWFSRAGLPSVAEIIAAARMAHADFLRDSLRWNAECAAEALGLDSAAALRMLRRRMLGSMRRRSALLWLRGDKLFRCK